MTKVMSEIAIEKGTATEIAEIADLGQGGGHRTNRTSDFRLRSGLT